MRQCIHVVITVKMVQTWYIRQSTKQGSLFSSIKGDTQAVHLALSPVSNATNADFSDSQQNIANGDHQYVGSKYTGVSDSS